LLFLFLLPRQGRVGASARKQIDQTPIFFRLIASRCPLAAVHKNRKKIIEPILRTLANAHLFAPRVATRPKSKNLRDGVSFNVYIPRRLVPFSARAVACARSKRSGHFFSVGPVLVGKTLKRVNALSGFLR
jgi:hypothetical protein